MRIMRLSVLPLLLTTFFAGWESHAGSLDQPIRIKEAFIGCRDQDQFNKLVTYAGQKDDQALKAAMMQGVLSGQCVTFSSGEEVYQVEVEVFAERVKLRKKGSTGEYWTSAKAIK